MLRVLQPLSLPPPTTSTNYARLPSFTLSSSSSNPTTQPQPPPPQPPSSYEPLLPPPPPPLMHALLPAFLRIWGQNQNQPLAERLRAIHRLYSVMFKICLKQIQILPKDTKKLSSAKIGLFLFISDSEKLLHLRMKDLNSLCKFISNVHSGLLMNNNSPF